MSQINKRRILLKLSGEILSGNHVYGIDPNVAQQLAKEVASLKKLDIDIGIVLGAGNIFRGRDASEKGMDRVTADYIGMVGTVINSVTLQDSLEQLGLETRSDNQTKGTSELGTPRSLVNHPLRRERANSSQKARGYSALSFERSVPPRL